MHTYRKIHNTNKYRHTHILLALPPAIGGLAVGSVSYKPGN